MELIYIIMGIAIFYVIYFFMSVFNSDKKLKKLYDKYMNIPNSRNLTGADIAFYGKRSLNLDIKLAYRKGVLTDGYSVKKKTVIMSEAVCTNISIAAAGIVAHELGHAVQHKNKTFLFTIVTFLSKFCKIFCGFALPCVIVGIAMYLLEWNQDTSVIIMAVGIILFFINILKNLLEIPLESNASEIGFRFLEDYELIDKKDYKKVKKLMRVAARTYTKGFFRQLIPFVKS